MKKIGSVCLIITLALLLLWQLPWVYSFLSSKKESNPFVLFSSVSDDFLISVNADGQRINRDTRGNQYSQSEVDSLLPFFYARQLLKDERFPDTVKHVPVTFKESQYETFFWKSSPRDINAPQIGVYQLMESSSPRVKLETPPDVFRITGAGITFIDIESNSVNEEKSNRFTDVMKKKGFAFPATSLSGIPSVKKDYDEGYLILDSNKALYHVKQMAGRPFVRKIDAPADIQLKNVFITEHRNRRTIGYATDSQDAFYVIELPDYRFKKVGIPAFIPEEQAMMIYGNPLDWTIKLTSKDAVRYYAVDATDYSLIGEYQEEQVDSFKDKTDAFMAVIGLRFTHPFDKFVYPRIGY